MHKSFLDRLDLVLENQIHSPTRKMIEKQSAFRASIGPSRSFGGVSDYRKKKFSDRLEESLGLCKVCKGMSGKLSDDLVAHDNMTIIPKNSSIEVVDVAGTVSDIRYEGIIINVDTMTLASSFEPVRSALDKNIDNVLIDPDVLFVLTK